MVIGHGGGGFQSIFNPIPANSAASVYNALDKLAIDGAELDVQLTKDKQLILYHDAQLNSQTNCQSCVSEQNLADLKACTYKNNLLRQGKPEEELLLLDDVLKKYASASKKPFLFLDTKLLNECNPAKLPDPTEFAIAIHKIVSKYKAQNWVYVESSSTDLLLALQQMSPKTRLIYYTKSIDDGIATATKYKFAGITTFNNLISKEQIKQAHENGLLVSVLGVKSYKGLREAIDKYPDAIQTDNVPRLARMLRHQSGTAKKQQLVLTIP